MANVSRFYCFKPQINVSQLFFSIIFSLCVVWCGVVWCGAVRCGVVICCCGGGVCARVCVLSEFLHLGIFWVFHVSSIFASAKLYTFLKKKKIIIF